VVCIVCVQQMKPEQLVPIDAAAPISAAVRTVVYFSIGLAMFERFRQASHRLAGTGADTNDQRTVIVAPVEPPAGARVPPQPMDETEAITNGELRRRVDQVFDQAVLAGDYGYLEGAVVFAETHHRLLTETSAKLTFESPSVLGSFMSWLREHYGDLLRQCTLQLQCSHQASVLEISTANRQYAEAANFTPEQLLPTKQHPKSEARGGTTATLTLAGRGLSLVLQRLTTHVGTLTEQHSRQFGSAQGSRREAQRAYLATIVSGCRLPMPAMPYSEPPHAPPTTQPIAEALSPLPPASITAIDPSLQPALERRMKSLVGALGEGDSLPTPDALHAELRYLAKRGDALGVAAAACMLWQQRELLPKTKLLERFQQASPEEAPVALVKTSAQPPRPASPTITHPPGQELLSPDEFAKVIGYDVRTVRETLCGTVFVKGVHYLQRPGGRKIRFIKDKALAAIFPELYQ